MRVLNWMHNKLYGSQEKKITPSSSAAARTTPTSNSHNEEFEDWSQTLLAIGTLGGNKMKEDASRTKPPNISQALQHSPDLSEEVVKLQKELTILLTQNPKANHDELARGKYGRNSLPLNISLNFPASLDADRHTMGTDDYAELSSDAKIILSKAKDSLAGNKGGIQKTSLKFLLKKMFVRHSGFVPTPSLRDPISESRTEKILKAMLRSKIYPHSTAQPTTKKYFDEQPSVKKYLDKQSEETKEEKGEQSSKWVKTDSEYIVLEI